MLARHQRSLIQRMGLLMGGIVLLAVASMVAAFVIANAAQGGGAAINAAGALRMQTYRTASRIVEHSTAAHDLSRLQAEIAEFERRLSSTVLTAAVPGSPSHPIRRHYQAVTKRWHDRIKPALLVWATHPDPANSARARYLPLLDAYIGDLHQLVGLLENTTEHKILSLRLGAAGLLLLTLALVTTAMRHTHTAIVLPLRKLIAVAQQITHGDFSARARLSSDDELGVLGQALDTAAAGMEQQLETKTQAIMEERSVIARELHDSLAQSLSYLRIQAALLRQELRHFPLWQRLDAAVGRLDGGLETTYRQLRELLVTFRLRVEHADLKRALQATVDEYRERSGLPISLSLDSAWRRLGPQQSVHVIYIVREALNNAARHAGASRLAVALRATDGVVEVSVSDDGKGLPPVAAGDHYGLAIMRERGRRLGGELRVDSPPAGGTRVWIRFPPPQQSSPEETLRYA